MVAAAAAVAAPDFSEGGAEFLDVAGDEVAVGVGVPDAGMEATGAGVAAGMGAGADVNSVGLLPSILSVMVDGALALPVLYPLDR